jgi:hypothetical protein
VDNDAKDFLKSLSTTQQLDQARSDLATIAKMIRAYYQDLRSEGFSAIEALTLTTNFQTVMLSQMKGKE